MSVYLSDGGYIVRKDKKKSTWDHGSVFGFTEKPQTTLKIDLKSIHNIEINSMSFDKTPHNVRYIK